LIEDGGEPVVLHHQADGGAVVEVLDDFVNVFGKAVDVGAEVRLQERMVLLIDLAERPFGFVGEGGLFWVEFEFLDELGESFSVSLGRLASTRRACLAPGEEHALQPRMTMMGRMTP